MDNIDFLRPPGESLRARSLAPSSTSVKHPKLGGAPFARPEPASHLPDVFRPASQAAETLVTRLIVGLFTPLRRMGALGFRAPFAFLRKWRVTAWLFRVRWFRVGVILFCLAFWIGAGYGCQALWRGIS